MSIHTKIPAMKEINDEIVFSIDDIPEPENLEDVIYTLMVNPNLSTIYYFNDFSDPSLILQIRKILMPMKLVSFNWRILISFW